MKVSLLFVFMFIAVFAVFSTNGFSLPEEETGIHGVEHVQLGWLREKRTICDPKVCNDDICECQGSSCVCRDR